MTIVVSRGAVMAMLAGVVLVLVGAIGFAWGTGRLSSRTSTESDATAAPVATAMPVAVTASAPPPSLPTVSAAQDMAPRMSMDAFKRDFDEGKDILIVDVRTAEEYAAGHIRGAISVPVAEVNTRLAELPQDSDIVLYCA